MGEPAASPPPPSHGLGAKAAPPSCHPLTSGPSDRVDESVQPWSRRADEIMERHPPHEGGAVGVLGLMAVNFGVPCGFFAARIGEAELISPRARAMENSRLAWAYPALIRPHPNRFLPETNGHSAAVGSCAWRFHPRVIGTMPQSLLQPRGDLNPPAGHAPLILYSRRCW